MAGEAREKCAVAAVVASDPKTAASELAYESLFAMQHRGTEASGLASLEQDGSLHSYRGRGLVRDVYDENIIRRLAGPTATGHNRYSTDGSKTEHSQPFLDESIGLAFGHNGNMPVTLPLERDLEKHNINTARRNDSEMIGLAIAQRIRDRHDLPSAVEDVYPLLLGAFSCVAMHDGRVVAFRDSKGIRPLAIGKFDMGYAIASETCGLDIIDASYEREVAPGEMVIITKDGIESRQLADGDSKLDMFEFVYFARHDSQLYGQSVNEVRRRFGEQLAKQHPPPYIEGAEDPLVVPIPDTSVPAAEGYADALGLKHRSAVIKNRYIGRTFMQPTDKDRKEQLRRKHNIIPEAIKGRDVILIDDSIVRMNTMPRLVALANHLGARSVSVLIASPPVRFPDFYGIDTPRQSELAAANMTIEEMRKEINKKIADKNFCKYLGFLSLDRMVAATGLPADMFTLACFNGDYPIDIGRHRSEITKPVSMEYVE